MIRRAHRDRAARVVRLTRTLTVAAQTLLAALVLGGCGGSAGHTSTGAAAATTATAPTAASLASARRLARSGAEAAAVHRFAAGGRPLFCGGTQRREVALTFDDGPGPYTRLVLAKLRAHHVQATFFAVARNIPLDPSALPAERAAGALGDHTITHPRLTALTPADARREIVGAQQALEQSSGEPIRLFRPPYGARDAQVDAIVRAQRMVEVLWNVDSADSLGAEWAQIDRNVIAGLRPGAIVLMHENHGQTVRALPRIFDALRRLRLTAVSIPRLLAEAPPSPAQLRAPGGGCGASSAVRGGGH